MKLLFFFIFLLFTPTMEESVPCLSPAPCECVNTVANCICNNRQNFVLRMEWTMTYFLKKIYLNGCGVVKLKDLATEFNIFDSVHIANVSYLTIESHSFSRVQGVSTLIISDVENLVIESQAFSGPNNLMKIVLRNVRIDHFRRELFRHVSQVDEFHIQDSIVDTAESGSLFFHNVKYFRIYETKFTVLEKDSIMINFSHYVSFTNSYFHLTEEESFLFTLVEMVDFMNCTFERLASKSILTNSIGNFTFSNSRVVHMETDALRDVRYAKNIELHHNVFEELEEDSLSLIKHANISIMGNRLACNCNNSWLWKRKETMYDAILSTSTCIEDTSITLDSLTPRFTPEGVCISLFTTSALDVENFSHDLLLSNESMLSAACSTESKLYGLLIILLEFLFYKCF